ncbi:class I SAM-dependent methyltransferase [Sulfoacidibacillus thermotolerans]|uniref:Uncharacterized protein n=1 Tax=Sulfoacidibacillus thermotolerans TaxID=1765684 RepID=A0A2U3D1R7_SULT2|nr:class I SAM-dependent methyltransferase [Sulfoacidibacillus thermotolerans]PWI55184.1 hypothetical protein BM613_13390 [Sulfoacidibacillus thermotolerans]
MNFKEQESATKLRGGYYTPLPIARFLSKWVLRTRPHNILEPSCGDGVFVEAFYNLHDYELNFTGVELIKEEADKARQAVSEKNLIHGTIINDNFLSWALKESVAGVTYDGLIGNPPYIRYQYLEEKDQQLAAEWFSRYGLAFTKHTNAWVPFVIASVGLLAPGGRLAMVIPSELLHVLHATSLRKFLLDQCNRILMIDPTELLFEEALQGTVLLMVEKKQIASSSSQGVSVVSAVNNDFLLQDPEQFFQNATYVAGDILNGKWMKVLLDPEELEVFEKVRRLPSVRKFKDIANVDVGIVTGANKFFLVDDETVTKYRLEQYVHPMFGRSEHCPGIVYDDAVHQSNKIRGLPANFVMFGNTPIEKLSATAQEYIRLGEEQSLHTRYKCRIRSPWYAVPSVYSTSIGMLKRSHWYPRLILNTAGAYTTDTAYRIEPTVQGISPELLVFSFVNSLTALTAELEGRHYGGGVLELVPSEIEKLLIPVSDKLVFDIRELDEKVKSGQDVDSLLAEQDTIVLKAAGFSSYECEIIHEAWRRIRTRRHRLIVEN